MMVVAVVVVVVMVAVAVVAARLVAGAASLRLRLIDGRVIGGASSHPKILELSLALVDSEPASVPSSHQRHGLVFHFVQPSLQVRRVWFRHGPPVHQVTTILSDCQRRRGAATACAADTTLHAPHFGPCDSVSAPDSSKM